MIYIKSYEQYFCLLTFLFYFKNVLVLLFISGIIYIETIILLEVYMNNKAVYNIACGLFVLTSADG